MDAKYKLMGKRIHNQVRGIRDKASKFVDIPYHKEVWKFQCGCGDCQHKAIYRAWAYCAICGKPIFRRQGDWILVRNLINDKDWYDSTLKLLGINLCNQKLNN